MAKNKNVVDDSPVLRYEADPSTFRTIVLKVHKKLQSESDPYVDAYKRSEGENDAMLMSQEFPNDRFITIYQNGMPATMTVNELVRDVILSVFGNIDLD